MLRVKYYDSIDDLSIFNYLQAIDGKVSAIVKKRGIFGNDVKALERIQSQLIARFGMNEHFMNHLELIKEITLLKIEVVITGDRFHNTFIRIKEAELKEMEATTTMNTDEMKVTLEKWLGFKINMKELSVAEWYGYIKQLSDYGRRQSVKQE